MAVGRHETDGGHEFDGLQHDVGQGRVDGTGQQRQRLLVLKHGFQSHLNRKRVIFIAITLIAYLYVSKSFKTCVYISQREFKNVYSASVPHDSNQYLNICVYYLVVGPLRGGRGGKGLTTMKRAFLQLDRIPEKNADQ